MVGLTARRFEMGCLSELHLGDVHLADHVLFVLDVFAGLGDEDAFALAACVWLADVRLTFFGSGVNLEVTVTAKQNQNQVRMQKKKKKRYVRKKSK